MPWGSLFWTGFHVTAPRPSPIPCPLSQASAYFKAANVLRQHDEVVTSGAQAQKLKGIGKKIAKKIDEILATVGCVSLAFAPPHRPAVP